MAEKNRIKEHRERAGLTQSQLAALCGTQIQTICRLELGQRALSGRWLDRLAEALAVPKGALLLEPGHDGTLPLECDLVHDDTERTLLMFWRSLPRDGQHAVLSVITGWAAKAIANRPASVRRA